MRRFAVAVVVLAVVACKKPEAPPRPTNAPTAPAAAAPAASQGNPQILRGKVLEKVDVSQYSYLKLATASGEAWAAVQKTDKKVGDEVGVANAFPMQGFESKELNRKFDVVYFGTLAGPGGEVAAMPPAMGGGMGAMGGGEAGGPPNPAQMAAQHQAVSTGPSDVKVEKVSKATGADARTVEEIWGQREKLKGKPVTVRGQVVKFTPVMGKNFLHLRDGSGNAEKKNNDVTVTTADSVAVGDVVTAKGVIVVDKDFGSGYAYPVMIEDAKVAK
jgi:hypothetical protein